MGGETCDLVLSGEGAAVTTRPIPHRYSSQVKNNPYFSHADKQLVVAEHESKRLTDPLHIAIDQDMRALAKANSRKGTRVQRFFDVGTMRKDSYADAALLVALDYNTVRAREREMGE